MGFRNAGINELLIIWMDNGLYGYRYNHRPIIG